MARRKTGLRRSLAIIIALVMVLTSGVAPLTQFAGVAYAASQDASNPTEVKDWAGLRDAVKDGGYIKITQDLVASGSSIDITKDVHIVGDNATIWRKEGDANFPVFNVKDGGKLELGKGLTLTGLTGSCSGGEDTRAFKVIWNDGSQDLETQDKNAGDTLSHAAPTPPEEGLTFAGWKWVGPSGEGSSTGADTGFVVPADTYGTMKIVAQWEKPAENGQFNVFRSNGASSNEKTATHENVAVDVALKYTPPADWAPENGYVFKGWKWIDWNGNEGSSVGSSDPADTGLKVPSNVYGTLTLIAQWEKPASVTAPVASYSGGYNARIKLGDVTTDLVPVSISYNQGIQYNSPRKDDLNGTFYISTGRDRGLDSADFASANEWWQGFATNAEVATEAQNNGLAPKQGANGKPVYSPSGLETYPKYQWHVDGQGRLVNGLGWALSTNESGQVIFVNLNGSGGSGGSSGTPTPYTSKNPVAFAKDTQGEGEQYESVDPTWSPDTTPAPTQGCEGDGGCKEYTTSDFASGTGDKYRGFFIEVAAKSSATLNGATLENFVTKANSVVKFASPVVAQGEDARFDIKDGTIKCNNVGYTAVNSKSQESADKIKSYIENTLQLSDTAGAVTYRAGAKGDITGGTITTNRADAGAIAVRGANTEVYMTGGTITKNVGVHYGGAAYVYNGGFLRMGGGIMSNNYAWNKGGAVYVSDEEYGSTKWMQPNSTKKVGKSLFSFDGGTLTGNFAVNRGGAIYVESDGVALLSGNITNNYSRSLGGAIYVAGDGIQRMYQLYVSNGCITGNTAVKAAPELNKYLGAEVDGQCNIKNNWMGDKTLAGDNKDYAGYSGYGGGLWLCAFGGNATFGYDLDQPKKIVIIDGNTADTQGDDIKLRPTRPGEGSGINIVGNIDADNNKWINEKTNKPIEPNTTYTGPLPIRNDREEGCDSALTISGNIARVGGAIAANGTVVFGPENEAYRLHTALSVKKHWGEGVEREDITLALSFKDEDGKEYPLEGYSYTLTGKPTPKDQITENTKSWEEEDWTVGFGLPLTYIASDGTVKPVFTFTDPDNGNELDPSSTNKETGVARIYELVKADRLTGAKLNANLVITETVKGAEPTQYEFSSEDITLNETSYKEETHTYYDKAKAEVGKVTTKAAVLNFGQNVSNTKPEEEKPEVEKYINNVVHQSLGAFDEEFEYEVMAYVPKDATEATISDTLENTLEFVNKTPATVLSALQILKDNDHKGDGNGTVKTNQVEGANVKTRDATMVMKNQRAGCSITVKENTVSLTLDKGFIDNVKEKDTNGQGFWVKMTFKAKYNLDYIKTKAGEGSWLNFVEGDDSWLDDDADKSGGAKLLYIQNNGEARWNPGGNRYILLVDGVYYRSNPLSKGDKATTWEQHPNQSQWAGGDFAPLEVMDASVIDGDVSKIKLPEGAVTYNGNVVEAKEPHHGTKNQGEFTVKRGNNSESTHKTNEVTVEPKNVKFEAEKKWLDEKGQATEWPKDAKITFTLWKINNDGTEEELESKEISSFEKVEFKEQPKLNSARYEVRESVEGVQAQVDDIKTETKDATDDTPETTTTTFTNKISDEPEVEKYVNNKVHVNLENFDEVFEYSIMGFVPADATEVTITDELVPDLRFVDADGNIQGVDAGFNPQNVVVNKSGFHGLVIEGATNNHNANGSGTVTGHNKAWFDNNPGRMLSDMLDKVKVEGNKISITINKDMMDAHAVAKYDKGTTDNDLRGKNIILSYKAVINPESYEKVLKQIAAGEKESADSSLGLKWEKITSNDSSIDVSVDGDGESHSKVFNGKDVESDGSHAGIINKANFKVKINNGGTFNYDTNTVTVKPKTQELEVEKTWAGTDGNKWPEEVSSVTFGLFKTKEGVEEPEPVKGSVDEKGKYTTGTDDAVIELTSKKTKVKVTGLPKLEGVTYSAREIKVGGVDVDYNDTNTAGVLKQGDVVKYIVKMIREKLAGSKIDNKFIATNSAPSIEKYVNQDVHAELETFNEEFTYDIMAFVPAGSTKITITDVLKEQLTLNSKEEDIKATIVYKEENDHIVQGSVKAASGTAITEGVNVKIDPANTVEITVKNANGYLDGMWVQATLKAQINEDKYNEVLKKIQDNDQTEDPSLWWAKITKNEPVTDGAKNHTGATNKASYKIEVGTESTSDYESNVVTVVPKTVTYGAEKAWMDESGNVVDTWPKDKDEKDIAVTFKLFKVKDGVRSEVLGSDDKPVTVTLTKDAKSMDFPPQPKIDGVTYEVEEVPVEGYMIADEETTTAEDKVAVKVTNKPEKPEIEKYINKNVHKFIAPTETFTYDIIGYVTKDAVEVQFIDALVSSLQFAEEPNVKIQDLGTEVDHKPNGSVSKTGTEIKQDAAGVEVILNKELKALTVNLTGEAANAARGHWVKVTFDAELDSDLVKDLESGAKTIKDLDSNMVEVQKGVVLEEDAERPAENEGNLPVITDEKHKGLPNTSVYTIKAENDGTYSDKSNTVTVKPEKPEIEKYINKNVHKFIALEEEFTYDIIAYVTNDADKVEITDTLVNDLEFVSQAGDIVVRDLGETVDHTPYGSVSENGKPVKSSAKIDGKTLTITIGNAEPHRGHWVKATFVAKLDQKSVVDAINAGEKQISDLENKEIKKDAVLQEDEGRAETKKGNLPVITEEEHDGVPNTSSYRIKVGNEYKYNDKSNTVTVKPEKPELEKYINKNVHEFVALDEVFTYDIIAYVPNDADELTITDDLDKQLQFAKGKDGANVKVFDIGTTNNHKTGDKATEDKVDASVNNSEKDITEFAAIKATDGKLEVVIANEISHIDNNTGIITYTEGKEKLSPYRGHYIRVQFDAQLADDVDINNLTTVEITENEPLDVTDDQKDHDGIENKSSYTFKVGNDGKYETESNTVTVTPEEPSIEKYVNNDVHWDMSEFDRLIKYDILVFVPHDADKLQISDTLVNALEFANGKGDAEKPAVASSNKDEVVTSIVAKPENNHKVKGTVSETGGEPLGDKAQVTIDKQNLLIEIDDAKPYHGSYIQATFWAKYTDKIIEAVKIEDTDTITGNGAVLEGVEEHYGTTNDATYKLFVNNEWSSDYESNTVTVEPKTVVLEAEKQWQDIAGEEMSWPDEVNEVVINIINTKNNNEVVDTIVLNSLETKKSNELPKLVGVEYALEEVSVPGYLTTTEDGKLFVNKKNTILIPVIKTWDDNADFDGRRTTSVVMNLLQDGEIFRSLTITNAAADSANPDVWYGAFTDVPYMDEAGHVYEYTVEEVPVAYYLTEYSGSIDTEFKVTNIHRPWFPEIPETPGEEASFVIKKETTGAAETDKVYNVEISLTFPPEYVAEGEEATYTYTMELKPGEEYTVDKLPAKTQVTIKETSESSKGYEVSYLLNGKDCKTVSFAAETSVVNRVVVINYKAPEKPEKPDKPKEETPKTGDESNMMMWISLAGLAGATTVVMATRRRRNYK